MAGSAFFHPAMNDNFSFSLSYFFPIMPICADHSIMPICADLYFFGGNSAFSLSDGVCCPTQQTMNLSNITPSGTPFRPGLSIPAPGLLPTFREAFLSSLARPLYHKIKRLIITKVSTKMLSHV